MAKTPADFLVLVVDDEEDIRTFLTAALEDAGYEVVTASDGKEALAQVKARRPDFISLDLVMPGGTGIAFVHELRRNKQWINIPVTVVTGHAQDELGRADLATALQDKLLSGPHAYLEKPITPEKYVAAVGNALGLPVDTPAPTKPDGGQRQEAARLLQGASSDQVAEILKLLKGKG
jgi:CheY-like chemotaxis protein